MKQYLDIRRILALCIAMQGIFLNTLNGQDPLFSQYYSQAIHINPGFAGISFAPRFEVAYRNQWPLVHRSFAGYVTYSLSYDQFFKDYNSGLGIQILADNSGGGLLKSWKIAGTYGYQARISGNNFLRGGIELGLVRTSYDWDKYIFSDQIDPEFGPISPGGNPFPTGEIRPDQTELSYLDIGTGMLFYNPHFNFGISAKHLNTPKNDILKVNGSSYSGIPIRWVFHGGFQWDLSRSSRINSILSPGFMLAVQSKFLQLNIGTQYQISKLFAGLWYRYAKQNPDAIIGVFGIKSGAWKIGYSFDFTLSDLGIEQGGSHELSLGIYLSEIMREKANISDCFEAFR